MQLNALGARLSLWMRTCKPFPTWRVSRSLYFFYAQMVPNPDSLASQESRLCWSLKRLYISVYE
jgi:hypothetical protein